MGGSYLWQFPNTLAHGFNFANINIIYSESKLGLFDGADCVTYEKHKYQTGFFD